MDNLESDWDFSAPSLTLDETSDHFALRICAVDLKNKPKTAETLIKVKRCLAAAQISVEVTDIKAKPLRDGAKSTLQESLLSQNCFRRRQKMLKLVCDGQSGAHRPLF